MEINIYAFGSEKYVRECRSVLGEMFVEGEPGPGDIVLIERPVITDPFIFQDAKKYSAARVFLISPPSLNVWREATKAGITVLSSVEDVVPKIQSHSGFLPAKKSGFGITQIQETISEPKQDVISMKVQEIPSVSQEPRKEEQSTGIVLNSPLIRKLDAISEKNISSSLFKKRGRLICVYSLIGGVGKTTISLNLAELLKYLGGDPCLVDFDFNSAGSTVYFWPKNVPSPPETILFWEDFPIDKRESRETVEKFLAKVPFGFHVLPAPKDIMLSSLVSDVLSGTVLDVLLDHFDNVIVDLGTDMKQFGAKKALSMADTVLMIARPDDVSVSGAVRFLGHVGPGKLIRPERLKFVVNRDRPRAPRRPKEVADEVGLRLDFVLPEDEQSIAEASKRHTLPVNLKDSTLGDAITKLAEGIIPDLKANPAKESLTNFSAFMVRLVGIFSWPFKKKGDDRSENIVDA